MKTILSFMAVCFTAAILGCQTTETVSPGAVSECGANCAEKCCDKDKCCDKAAEADASMGAVGEADCAKKCCPSKCSKEADASMGAVSESKCSSKSSCKKACPAMQEADANLGAVSDKTECEAAKKCCGSKK